MNKVVKIIPRTLQEITLEQAIKSFLLECRTKNLSSRTTGRYEEHIEYFVNYLKKPYLDSECALSLVTEHTLKTFIQYHKQRENQRKQQFHRMVKH